MHPRRSLYHDKTGAPLTFDEYERLKTTPGYIRVARTAIHVDGKHIVNVSTVWLGVGAEPADPPLIFETAIWASPDLDDGDSPSIPGRYPTEDAARRGHDEVVKELADCFTNPVITDISDVAEQI